jgi:hypothetical protein
MYESLDLAFQKHTTLAACSSSCGMPALPAACRLSTQLQLINVMNPSSHVHVGLRCPACPQLINVTRSKRKSESMKIRVPTSMPLTVITAITARMKQVSEPRSLGWSMSGKVYVSIRPRACKDQCPFGYSSATTGLHGWSFAWTGLHKWPFRLASMPDVPITRMCPSIL